MGTKIEMFCRTFISLILFILTIEWTKTIFDWVIWGFFIFTLVLWVSNTGEESVAVEGEGQ